MKPPMKLNSIDQEHLQELYNSAGVARDELPYTPTFEALVQGFQDRTFKNADPEQVFSAIIKYVRSSGNASTQMPAGTLTDEQMKQLKAILSRHAVGGKVLPYSDEFTASRNEFNKVAAAEMTDQDFWRSILRLQGTKRRPPVRKKVAAAAEEPEEDGE
jgi:hypothetical protein